MTDKTQATLRDQIAIAYMQAQVQAGALYSSWDDLSGDSYKMADAMLKERNSRTTKAISAAVFNTDCEYTLEQVIGDAELSVWARWVAVDKDGEVYEYSDRPFIHTLYDLWNYPVGGECSYIKVIESPSDFTKCIWKIKK